MDSFREYKESSQGDSAKEWRTLRCLLRKQLDVPRRDISRLRRMGITSVERLLQIHYTMVPTLWIRVRIRGGAYVQKVAMFNYWAQEVEYNNDGEMRGKMVPTWQQGWRPGTIADDVVERFAKWFEDEEIVIDPEFPEEYRTLYEENRRKVFMLSSVCRYANPEIVGEALPHRTITVKSYPNVSAIILLPQAAPYLLAEHHRVEGQPVPKFKHTLSEEELEKARVLFREVGFEVGAVHDREYVDAPAMRAERWADRLVEEKRVLWEESMVVPQPTDGFESDRSFEEDSVGEDTDREDEKRRVDYSAEEQIWREEYSTRAERRAGHRWAQEDTTIRACMMHNLAKADRETQDRYIIQMYKATVREGHKRKILTALADLEDIKRQRTAIQAFCKEMIEPDCGSDPDPVPTDDMVRRDFGRLEYARKRKEAYESERLPVDP